MTVLYFSLILMNFKCKKVTVFENNAEHFRNNDMVVFKLFPKNVKLNNIGIQNFSKWKMNVYASFRCGKIQNHLRKLSHINIVLLLMKYIDLTCPKIRGWKFSVFFAVLNMPVNNILHAVSSWSYWFCLPE